MKRAEGTGAPPPTCRACAKVFNEARQAALAVRDYVIDHDGVLCRSQPACRGRVLHTYYEKQGLKKWSRHTQEQLLLIMDLPPANWDRAKKWESVHEIEERVLAAVEFYSTCYPVCLLYAVQTDADGEPIKEFGDWKHHTTRSLGDVLGVHQSTVVRSIQYWVARKALVWDDGRIYFDPSPKSLLLSERDACTRRASNGINELAELKNLHVLLPGIRNVLAELLPLLQPDACIQIVSVATDAATRLKAEFSDARARASKTVLDACNGHLSLLSRATPRDIKSKGGASSRSGNGSHTQNQAGDENGGPPVNELYTDELIDVDDDEFERRIEASWDEHHAAQDRADHKRAGRRTPEPDIPPDKLQAAGLGKGALAKLPSPRPSIEDQPALLVARELQMDDDAVNLLVARCKTVEPTITGPEIVHLARTKLEHVKVKIRNGGIETITGFLIGAVPKMCKGEPLRLARELLEEERRGRTSRIAYAREAWPELNEEERAEALQKYPELAGLGQ